MRIRVLKSTRAYWNYAIQEFQEGDELDGDLARHLADNAPAKSVEVIEADPEPDPPVAPMEGAPDSQPDGAPADGGGGAAGAPPVDGAIDDLMSWVNGERGRAAQALAAEQAKDKPRSTVVKRLAALVDTEE